MYKGRNDVMHTYEKILNRLLFIINIFLLRVMTKIYIRNVKARP